MPKPDAPEPAYIWAELVNLAGDVKQLRRAVNAVVSELMCREPLRAQFASIQHKYNLDRDDEQEAEG